MTPKAKTPGRKYSPGNYRFSVVDRELTMPDGVVLATTMYMPYRKHRGETFPVLLELLPYRKDDTFFLLDYPSYSYFARHGLIVVKVDIRGTGGSNGSYPNREYSDQELDDAVEIIRQLARLPKSNGNVAMWGVSWSGFNAIQVAMRRPPELKTIVAMHASDDLFHDDLHYIDGVLHLDPYHLFINHETGLPRTPQYRLDKAYFHDRFDQKPWLFEYLSHPQDGDFWRRKSLFCDYTAIDIPVYIIGGLQDGYRDTVVRLLENLCVPVRAELGPWDHSCPDDGTPGPNYEWQDEAIVWFDHFLKGHKNSVEREAQLPPRLTTFVRSGDSPDANSETVSGHWRHENWPIERVRLQKFYPATNGRLLKNPGKKAEDSLVYVADSGTAAGTWWGDSTGDMRGDDAYSLVYDSTPVDGLTEIVGQPSVKLSFRSQKSKCNWSIRLEDVAPDGSVALVTGALFNSRHICGRLTPCGLKPGKTYQTEVKLHFTTWTFRKGHKIRLSVSNAQFPMAWPSPDQMTTTLDIGNRDTAITLPVIPGRSKSSPLWRKPKLKPDNPHGDYIETGEKKPDLAKYVRVDSNTGKTSFVLETNSAYRVHNRQFFVSGKNVWSTSRANPAESQYLGNMQTEIRTGRRIIRLKTRIALESTATTFNLTVTRSLTLNGRQVRQKTWKQTFARVNH